MICYFEHRFRLFEANLRSYNFMFSVVFRINITIKRQKL